MRTIQDWLLAGAIAVAVAIFCHFFLFESYVVDGDSMEPSLSFGQHILVATRGIHRAHSSSGSSACRATAWK